MWSIKISLCTDFCALWVLYEISVQPSSTLRPKMAPHQIIPLLGASPFELASDWLLQFLFRAKGSAPPDSRIKGSFRNLRGLMSPSVAAQMVASHSPRLSPRKL